MSMSRLSMDNSASYYTVAQGTFITSALSAFVTGLHGIASRNPNYGLLAGAAAVNSGVTAATFFGLREYAIGPVLVHTLPWPQYARRRRELGLSSDSSSKTPLPPLSWADRRARNLLDSGLSGAVTGGIVRGWKSGPTAVLPGAVTAATICVLLQYAFNEAGNARLRYISRHAPPTEPPLHNGLDHEQSPTLTQRMLHLIGVRKMADNEYIDKMKKTRDHHLRRIAQLEKQLEAELKANGDDGHKE